MRCGKLDGRPAFDAYKEHARKRGVSLTPSGAGEYLIANELGVMLGDRVARARAPLSVGPDGSLTCAAGVRQGSQVAILDGVPKNMVAAARAAAEEAKANLQGARPAGVLLFDCVCRGMILKNDFQQEIEAIRSVMGDVPVWYRPLSTFSFTSRSSSGVSETFMRISPHIEARGRSGYCQYLT